MAALGLVEPERVAGGHVVRVPKAYPVYDAEYAGRVERIRGWLDGISNLQQIGRNGLHRYNNSDHSMLTAMRAVENLCDGAGHDVWAVNADGVYHEREEAEEQPYGWRRRRRLWLGRLPSWTERLGGDAGGGLWEHLRRVKWGLA